MNVIEISFIELHITVYLIQQSINQNKNPTLQTKIVSKHKAKKHSRIQ